MKNRKNTLKCPLCLEDNSKCRYYKEPLPADSFDVHCHSFIGMDMRSPKLAQMFYDTVAKDHVRIYAI